MLPAGMAKKWQATSPAHCLENPEKRKRSSANSQENLEILSGSSYLDYQRCTATLPAEAFSCSGEYDFDSSATWENQLIEYFTCIGIL